MGASAAAVMPDKLGRRSGPRRKHTIVEKLAMVEETQCHSASVPEVAQRHGVNANLLTCWRRIWPFMWEMSAKAGPMRTYRRKAFE
jgi:Transposase